MKYKIKTTDGIIDFIYSPKIGVDKINVSFSNDVNIFLKEELSDKELSDKELLENNGWKMECESPLEIRHIDGSFASNLPAFLLIKYLREDENEV